MGSCCGASLGSSLGFRLGFGFGAGVHFGVTGGDAVDSDAGATFVPRTGGVALPGPVALGGNGGGGSGVTLVPDAGIVAADRVSKRAATYLLHDEATTTSTSTGTTCRNVFIPSTNAALTTLTVLSAFSTGVSTTTSS